MIPAAIPFAMAAALYPAGLAAVLWLLATPPGMRRGLVYLAGAATSTFGSGVVILAMLHGVENAPGRRSTIEGSVQVVIGGALIVVAAVLVVRRPRVADHGDAGPAAEPRLRAGGLIGIFLLGVTMWTPSFAYLAALQLIVDADLPLAAQAVNLVVIDVIILAGVELPLLLYRFASGPTTRALTAVQSVLRRHAWEIGAAAAGLGGGFLIVRGWLELAR